MGLFDVFSKSGRYFGKAIEPKCEYCEHGKRTTDGNKVLCTRKGMVDAEYHCPKFLYSPLKRIPVKQMKMVGFLEGDYDEKDDDELAKRAAERRAAAEAEKKAAEGTENTEQAEKAEKAENANSTAESKPAEAEIPVPAPSPVPKQAADALASLAQAVESAVPAPETSATAPDANAAKPADGAASSIPEL